MFPDVPIAFLFGNLLAATMELRKTFLSAFPNIYSKPLSWPHVWWAYALSRESQASLIGLSSDMKSLCNFFLFHLWKKGRSISFDFYVIFNWLTSVKHVKQIQNCMATFSVTRDCKKTCLLQRNTIRLIVCSTFLSQAIWGRAAKQQVPTRYDPSFRLNILVRLSQSTKYASKRPIGDLGLNPMDLDPNYTKLVGGPGPPLWTIWVRQLGWWMQPFIFMGK